MRLLVIVAAALLLPCLGCRQRCESLSPRAEVAYRFGAGVDPGRVATLRVLASLDGRPQRRRELSPAEAGLTDGGQRFVLLFDDELGPPTTLHLRLVALDAGGQVLGAADASVALAPNGCNRLSLVLGQQPGADGGVDRWVGDANDRGRRDAGLRCSGGFCRLEAGSFTMGTDSGSLLCVTNWEDVHQVTLTRAFELMMTEVSQQEFAARQGYNPSSVTCSDCPVESVTWHEAAAFCNALSDEKQLARCYQCSGARKGLGCTDAPGYEGGGILACPGYRLPTEAEWEYAYRAGTTGAFYNGAMTDCTVDPNANAIGWYAANSSGKTHPGCGKEKNPAGLCDMAGNVMEWAHDGFTFSLGFKPVTDPVTPPPSDESRVLRGGSFSADADSLRAAKRYFRRPTDTDEAIGFRCARSP